MTSHEKGSYVTKHVLTKNIPTQQIRDMSNFFRKKLNLIIH